MDSPRARLGSVWKRHRLPQRRCGSSVFVFYLYLSLPESFLMHTPSVCQGRMVPYFSRRCWMQGACVCVKYPKVRIWTCSACAVYFTGSDLPCVFKGRKLHGKSPSLSLPLPPSLSNPFKPSLSITICWFESGWPGCSAVFLEGWNWTVPLLRHLGIHIFTLSRPPCSAKPLMGRFLPLLLNEFSVSSDFHSEMLIEQLSVQYLLFNAQGW